MNIQKFHLYHNETLYLLSTNSNRLGVCNQYVRMYTYIKTINIYIYRRFSICEISHTQLDLL